MLKEEAGLIYEEYFGVKKEYRVELQLDDDEEEELNEDGSKKENRSFKYS